MSDRHFWFSKEFGGKQLDEGKITQIKNGCVANRSSPDLVR
jgi:hypothetical protein